MSTLFQPPVSTGQCCVDINEIIIFYKKPLPMKKISPKKTLHTSRKIAHRPNIMQRSSLNTVSWVLIVCLFKLSFLLNLPSQILQVKLASVSFLRMLLISPFLLYIYIYICLFKLSRLEKLELNNEQLNCSTFNCWCISLSSPVALDEQCKTKA